MVIIIISGAEKIRAATYAALGIFPDGGMHPRLGKR